MASTTRDAVPNGNSLDKETNANEMEHSVTPPQDLESSQYTNGEKAAQATAHFHWDFDVITNLTVLFFSYFASTWTIAFPNASSSYIVLAYPTESDLASWITAAHTISLCVVSAFIGSLSDIFGRKLFITIGPLLTFIGSLIAGRASSIRMVVGGQTVNGIGFACGYLAVTAIMEIVPKSKRPDVTMFANVSCSLAYIIGVLVAGGFIQHNTGGATDGWRACFYLSAGFNFLAFVLLVLLYHPPRTSILYPNLSISARLRKVDWIGIFLVSAGLTIFLVGLEYGNNPYKWDSAHVLAPIIIGAAVIFAFAIWEWLGTKSGLLDHRLFAHRNFGLMVGLSWLSGIVLFGLPAFFPQLVTHLWSPKPVTTGVYSLPINVAMIAGGFFGGILMVRTKEDRWLISGSFLMILLGGGLLAVEQPHINFAAWFFPTAILGVAVGIQSTIMPVIASLCTPNELIGHTVNIFFSSRAVGGTMGVVILDIIFNDKVTHKLPSEVAKAALAAKLPPTSLKPLLQALQAQSAAALKAIPGITPQIIMAAEKASMQAYADSFRFVFYSLIAISGAWSIISLFVRSTKKQMTPEVACQVTHRGFHRFASRGQR